MTKRSRSDFLESYTATSLLDESTTPRQSQQDGSGNEHEANADSRKVFHMEDTRGETNHEVMRCILPPHQQAIIFHSFDDYDVHYRKCHVNRCLECQKNFPTSHFLDLHQEEHHNPLLDVLRDRGQRTFSCFVEDCERKCSSSQKRRLHLIDKHAFPKEYNFNVVNDGIDQRSSMLRLGSSRRRSYAARSSPGTVRQGQEGEQVPSVSDQEDGGTFSPNIRRFTSKNALPKVEDVDELIGAMSALKFVPSSIRFGRGGGRRPTGFSKTSSSERSLKQT